MPIRRPGVAGVAPAIGAGAGRPIRPSGVVVGRHRPVGTTPFAMVSSGPFRVSTTSRMPTAGSRAATSREAAAS